MPEEGGRAAGTEMLLLLGAVCSPSLYDACRSVSPAASESLGKYSHHQHTYPSAQHRHCEHQGVGVTATTLDVSIVTVNHALNTTVTTSPSALAPAPVSVTSPLIAIVFITPSA